MATSKSTLHTYSPEDVVIILNRGEFTHQVSGYTDGTFIGVTRVIPHSTPYVGADGHNARTVRAVRNADITLTLSQVSKSNDFFSKLLEDDERTRDGSACFEIIIKDTTGRTVMSSPECYINTIPDSEFSTEISDVAWVFHAIDLSTHLGGNGRLSPDDVSALTDLGYTVENRWVVS